MTDNKQTVHTVEQRDVQEEGDGIKVYLQSADVYFWETSSNLGSKRKKNTKKELLK